MNVAIGGTNEYFPDGVDGSYFYLIKGKPWSNTEAHAVNSFWDNKESWYQTWNGDDVAMKVDWVKGSI